MQRARTDEAKDLRRRSVLTAALDEFFERGFAAARMDDIARRAGVSKGALYLYFDSKDDLFRSLIEEFAAPNVDRLEAAAASAPDAKGAIRALLTLAPTLIRTSPIPKIAKVLIGDAASFPDTVTIYRKRVIERALRIITAVLAKAKSKGEFEIDDPKLTARLIVAPVIFSAIWRVVFEHDESARVDLEALFALHEKILLKALAP